MSMKELKISDGDYVLLSKTELRSGDVGTVLYKGETTLKKVHKEKNQIRLKPANPSLTISSLSRRKPKNSDIGKICGPHQRAGTV
jgi:SOS-response transcriptional repressor LexA